MRPAGARNYLRWRRSIDEHLELGRLTWDEYAMFSWLCTKADPRGGRLRTSWPTLAEQTTLSANHAGKLCRSLRGKGYIAFPEHTESCPGGPQCPWEPSAAWPWSSSGVGSW